jgi:hypothetical protein
MKLKGGVKSHFADHSSCVGQARTVLDRSNTGVTYSNPVLSMDRISLFIRFNLLNFLVLCSRDIAIGRSPTKGIVSSSI